MSIRDLEQQDFSGEQPPSADVLAGEYALGVLDAQAQREAESRIASDPGFARLVRDWEQRLAPWHDTMWYEAEASTAPPAHLWPRIRTQLGWSAAAADADALRSPVAPPASLWQRAGLWQATTALAAGLAIVAFFAGRDLRSPQDTPTPGPVVVTPVDPKPPVDPPVQDPPVEDPNATRPVTTLASDDGRAGWLASVDRDKGTVLMVPVPSAADAQGRVPELWLIPPGESPKSLGIVSHERAHTVKVPDTLREALTQGAILAITLEPPGGAPQGIATGPSVAKGDLVTL
jgi:anti-sigma-K factor RskA